MIVYLDPDDYKEETKKKQEKKETPPPSREPARPGTQRPGSQQRRDRKRTPKVDAMRTTGNFYPRDRGHQSSE